MLALPSQCGDILRKVAPIFSLVFAEAPRHSRQAWRWDGVLCGDNSISNDVEATLLREKEMDEESPICVTINTVV